MNRSEPTPRPFSTDQLHVALGDVGGPVRLDYLTDIVAQAGRMRQRPGWMFPGRWLPIGSAVGREGDARTAVLLATMVLLALLAAASSVYVGSRLTRPVELGVFEPVTRPLACERQDAAPGTTLGCTRDGRRLLVQKDDLNLFVVDADGSETQLTEQRSALKTFLGSARPSGATISPDGSRVVFTGVTTVGRSCHNGALFAVGGDGGQAVLLWTSHVPQNGIVRDPTFSPDGMRIAFVDGYCDHDHIVWLMNADGSDAHQILVAEDAGLGAGHVYGLAWSPAGDRIALKYERGWYTFAPDGSDLRRITASDVFCWPGRRC